MGRGLRSQNMSQKVAILDGAHFTDRLEEVVNAYYTRPNTKHANLFKEELENKGIAIRVAGDCIREHAEVLFLARRSQEKYAYQNILFPRLYPGGDPIKG